MTDKRLGKFCNYLTSDARGEHDVHPFSWESSMLDARCWMLDVGCWVLDNGYWMLGAR